MSLGSCSLSLVILAMALFLVDELGQTCSDLEEILGTMKGLGGGCLRTERLMGETWGEKPQASPQGQAQWGPQSTSQEWAVWGPVFLVCLVVIIEDCFDGGRPRSKQPYGKGSIDIYDVRVTFLTRNSETC